MFSLIITILSIALVIVLAIAVIYYGGDSTKSASTRAIVDTLINQSQQINAAGTIAVAQGAGWPQGAPQFTQPYLTAMPVPPKGAYVSGITPAATDWEYLVPGGSAHHFVLRDKIRKDVCMAINKMMGFNGIPAAWDGTSLVQCYGSGQTVPDGYTFLYDPPGSTQEQNNAALDQTLTEGGTNTPGYPRLCADGSSIVDGLCPGGGSTIPPSNGGGGNGTDPLGDNGTGAPTEAQCAANPSLPACDASKYPALLIDNFKGLAAFETVRFTAVSDCAQPLPANAVCLPAFRSKHRSWTWGTGFAPTHYSETYQDQFGAQTRTDEYGFFITDGTNTYTIQGSSSSGSRETYIPINDYPRTALGDGNFSVNCATVKADIVAKGGVFLPNTCTTIQTIGQYTWSFHYTDISQFDTRSVNGPNLGMYYNNVQTGTTYTFQTYASTDVNKLIIGKVVAPYSDVTPLGFQSGNTNRWPQAPLDTTNEALGPL